MRVIVVGLGSMGKRRIRLLKKIKQDIKICGVDLNVERAAAVQEEYGIDVCKDLDYALSTYGATCAIVSTAPIFHGGIISKCLHAGLHVFTEINLVSDLYAENISLANERNLTLFLSSTFLYRDEIAYILECIKNCRDRLNYSYHIGQYLPDWHPWENYNQFFVGDKRTNGCREIFAIELPWLVKAFGKVVNYKVICGKNTSLSIDYPDNYMVLLEHESGHKGMLAVDIMSRKAVRNLEIFGENLHLFWDGTPYGLKEYDINEKQNKEVVLYENIDTINGYSNFIIENAYQKELESFFATVAGDNQAKHTFEEDLEIIKLIDAIEVC